MSAAGPAFALLNIFHVLAVLAFLSGVVFFFIWAAKTLSPAKLKQAAVMLVSVGIVACLFTIAVRGSLWNMGHGKGSSMKMGMGGMMGNMMDDDDMMEMSMDDMSDMLKGKTGDAFDEAFIEGMIPHHQGAIDMAKAALTDAKHAEIKRMAQAIISAQQKEIDQMHAWQKSWGYQE